MFDTSAARLPSPSSIIYRWPTSSWGCSAIEARSSCAVDTASEMRSPTAAATCGNDTVEAETDVDTDPGSAGSFGLVVVRFAAGESKVLSSSRL